MCSNLQEIELLYDIVIGVRQSRKIKFYLHKRENISEIFLKMLNLALNYNPKKHTKEKNQELYDAYEWICDENDSVEVLKTINEQDKYYVYLLKS